MRNQPAFTLLEMLIAITVFTIFIGFVLASYLTFHRADQEVISTRSLMLELQGTMNQISEAVRDNTIDYASYEDSSGVSSNVLSIVSSLNLGDALNESELYLFSPDGETQYVYTWNEDEETLTLQLFDADGNAITGYEDPVLLHGENTRVTYANFRIFPGVDPYEAENASDDDVQYQPMVQINLTFAVPGRIREEISLDLQTSITSRFYQ